MNKIHRYKMIANDLMVYYGVDVSERRVVVNPRAKRRLGRCCYDKKYIELSGRHVELGTEEEVIDTILHEIAHIRLPGAGHGRAWKALALSMGINPKSSKSVSYQEESARKAPWAIVCPTHGVIGARYRMSRAMREGGKYTCLKCGNRVFFEKNVS